MQVKAFVELVASLLSASISNPNSQDGPTPPGLAGEMLRVMKEAGVLNGLTNALKLIDTSHPQVRCLGQPHGHSSVLQATMYPSFGTNESRTSSFGYHATAEEAFDMWL